MNLVHGCSLQFFIIPNSLTYLFTYSRNTFYWNEYKWNSKEALLPNKVESTRDIRNYGSSTILFNFELCVVVIKIVMYDL